MILHISSHIRRPHQSSLTMSIDTSVQRVSHVFRSLRQMQHFGPFINVWKCVHVDVLNLWALPVQSIGKGLMSYSRVETVHHNRVTYGYLTVNHCIIPHLVVSMCHLGGEEGHPWNVDADTNRGGSRGRVGGKNKAFHLNDDNYGGIRGTFSGIWWRDHVSPKVIQDDGALVSIYPPISHWQWSTLNKCPLPHAQTCGPCSHTCILKGTGDRFQLAKLCAKVLVFCDTYKQGAASLYLTKYSLTHA